MKNTECPFHMTIKITKENVDYPCEIEICWNHNHPVKSLHALSFKEISKESEKTCKELFSQGLSPGKSVS